MTKFWNNNYFKRKDKTYIKEMDTNLVGMDLPEHIRNKEG